jgi:hypothetical protein
MKKPSLAFKHLGITPSVGKVGKAYPQAAKAFKGKQTSIKKFHPPKIQKPY